MESKFGRFGCLSGLNEVTSRALGAGIDLSREIRGIRDSRVRNIVRGVLGARTADGFSKTMARLHRECAANDAAAAGKIIGQLLSSRAAGGLPPFPDEVQPNEDTSFYAAQRLDLEMAIHSDRLAGEEQRLIDAISVIAELNQAILSVDRDAIERSFARYRDDFGVSTLVAMKALSLRNSAVGRELGDLDDSPGLGPFRRPRREVVTAAFEGTSNPDREYMQSRRFFMNAVNADRLHPADAALSGDMLSPASFVGDGLARRLEAFGRGSLVDLLAYIFRAQQILVRQHSQADADLLGASVPGPVRVAWERSFAQLDSDKLQSFVGRKDQFHDLELFSHLPAWSEYPALFEHRLDIEYSIGSRLDGFAVHGEHAASTLVLAKSSANAIADEPVESAAREIWHPCDGGFARTIALIASVEDGALEAPSGEELNHLLDRTLNVAILLSVDEIEKFLPRRTDDALYEYLRAALLFDAEGGATRNHAVRRAVERLLKERFDGDLVQFLEYADSAEGHVSQHLYNLCSEAFLSNLYGMYRLADDVIETQTRLLEWQGTQRNDQDAAERAKALRLLIRLRKVRGSIEETRIYVDPLRLMEWIHENLEDDLRSLQPLADEILAGEDVDFHAADTVTNTVQPRSRLMNVLNKAYEEFCSNKIHGAASYIGRRVRHGTFHGHVAVEMQAGVDAAVAEFVSIAPAFSEFLRKWMRALDKAADTFARERIHVRSKARTKGLIVASIEDPDKRPVLELAVASIARALRDKLQLTQVVALIVESCWLLMEADLKRARAAIENLRRDFQIEIEQHLTGRPEVDIKVTECVLQLNVALNQRFEAAKSWLTRRETASPTASVSLMVEAVLDEVSQRYPFTPHLELPENLAIDLIGNRFHFFYDALFILVTNAAKYGCQKGGLFVTVTNQMEPDDKHVLLSVSVTSSFTAGLREHQISEIEQRMSAEIGDAMDEDRGTGIRKLRGLVEVADEIVGFEWGRDADTVTFELKMRFPVS